MCVYVYVCECLSVCVSVSVCVVLPGLPGSRGASCAGRWIVLLGCGGAVSLLLWRMDVGDRGQAYHCVTSQTTGCHAPQSMTCPPPRALKTASFSLTFPAWVQIDSHCGKMDILCHHHQHQGLADDTFQLFFLFFVLSLCFITAYLSIMCETKGILQINSDYLSQVVFLSFTRCFSCYIMKLRCLDLDI